MFKFVSGLLIKIYFSKVNWKSGRGYPIVPWLLRAFTQCIHMDMTEAFELRTNKQEMRLEAANSFQARKAHRNYPPSLRKNDYKHITKDELFSTTALLLPWLASIVAYWQRESDIRLQAEKLGDLLLLTSWEVGLADFKWTEVNTTNITPFLIKEGVGK